jgi:hypothetical protein
MPRLGLCISGLSFLDISPFVPHACFLCLFSVRVSCAMPSPICLSVYVVCHALPSLFRLNRSLSFVKAATPLFFFFLRFYSFVLSLCSFSRVLRIKSFWLTRNRDLVPAERRSISSCVSLHCVCLSCYRKVPPKKKQEAEPTAYVESYADKRRKCKRPRLHVARGGWRG